MFKVFSRHESTNAMDEKYGKRFFSLGLDCFMKKNRGIFSKHLIMSSGDVVLEYTKLKHLSWNKVKFSLEEIVEDFLKQAERLLNSSPFPS